MPRSFLIKKNEKVSQKETLEENKFKIFAEKQFIKEQNMNLSPLTPLNRAMMYNGDKLHKKVEPEVMEKDRLLCESFRYQLPGYFYQRLSEGALLPAMSPFSALHTLSQDYYKDIYRDFLPPYHWYLPSLPTSASLLPKPLSPQSTRVAREADPEEEIHIDVEEIEEDGVTMTSSPTSGVYRSDEDSLHSPIDFSNYGRKIGEEIESRSSHDEMLSPMSYVSEDSTSSQRKAKGFQDGVTVGYTYEAFFISDGRSRKKGLYSENKQRYTCSICGKDYATSSNLSRHKQTHRNPESDQAKKCPHCNKVYVSMPALSMHILTHNLKHKCEECGKAFSRPWLLQGHLRSHTGEKPYGCAHCGKAFADRSNLRAHMQTHSSMKQYKCKRCDKSFALKSYLNKHYESACVKAEGEIIFQEQQSDLHDLPSTTHLTEL